MNEIEQGKSAKLRMKSSVIKTNEGKILKERERKKINGNTLKKMHAFKLSQNKTKILISSAKSQKTLFNIVEAPFKKLLNFDVCVV